MTIPDQPLFKDRVLDCTSVRYGLMALGLACVGLGVVGIFLPVMPSTIFFIIALWAFSRSSVRLHRWLYNHPRFGDGVRAWHDYKVIPMRAKVMAVTLISASYVFVLTFVAETWVLPTVMAAILVPVVAFIVTRPHDLAAARGDVV